MNVLLIASVKTTPYVNQSMPYTFFVEYFSAFKKLLYKYRLVLFIDSYVPCHKIIVNSIKTNTRTLHYRKYDLFL